ncbi:MAG TPA: GDSL-type esterase/lipase family protein [Thermoleophilaceae bacterium]|nr:GDSL-type esterase/lipase family protein [Thermoleophilaceae bacterium]
MTEPTTATTASDPVAAAGGPADPTGGELPHDVFAVPDPPPGRRGRARDALIVVGIAVLLLVAFQGAAVRGGAEELSPGIGRDVVEAVGEPTGWIADRLPFSGPTDDALAWLESDGEPEAAPVAGGGDVTLLVTGDSLAMPLDTELARRYAGSEVAVERDPHVGTGISKSDLVDWTELSAKQARRHDPDAVVVFIGANEGFSLPAPGGRQVNCCGAPWQAAFAARVREIADAYLAEGDARVYWLTVPKPRDPARQEIADGVNAAVASAAEQAGDRVRVIDLDETFAPDGDYTDAIDVDGRERIVREQDGIHLNAAGAAVAADLVQQAVDDDFAR